MSLKLKVSLILLAVFSGLFAANTLVLRLVLWPSFEALERQEAQRAMERVAAALDAESAGLLAAAQDWAVWDDAYRFARDRNPEFTRANLVTSVFTAYQLDLHYVFDREGERIGGRALAPDDGQPVELAVLPRRLPEQHFLRRIMQGQHGVAGFIATRQGPLLIAAHPILNSRHQGPARGLMVMGRFVTPPRVEQLSRRVLIDLRLLPPAALDALPAGLGWRVDGGFLEVTHPVAALDGGHALALRASLPREITASGARAINYTLALLIITAMVVLIAVLAVVQLVAIAPLTRLTRHVGRLAQSGTLEALHEERDDEFGFLAREFNRMQWRLSRLAFYDTLTDLPNRFMFAEQMGRALARAPRSGRMLAIYCVAVEGLDCGGDERARDALVQQLAQRFRANLRGCDVIARLGAAEFGALVEDLRDPANAGAVAEKILALRTLPFEFDGRACLLNFSVGVALASGHGSDDLLLAADIAMDEARRAGANGYRIYGAPSADAAASP